MEMMKKTLERKIMNMRSNSNSHLLLSSKKKNSKGNSKCFHKKERVNKKIIVRMNPFQMELVSKN